MPAAIPLTTPVPEPTVASDVLLLLHVPPVVASLKVVVEPIHTLATPVIDAGFGLTVTPNTAVQPAGSVYVMVAVPADTPVTIPVPAPTEAIEVLLLLHVPPLVASLSEVVSPTQTLLTPVIADGVGLTVSIIVVVQPAGNV